MSARCARNQLNNTTTCRNDLVVVLHYRATPLADKHPSIIIYMGDDIDGRHPPHQLSITAQWDDKAKVWAANIGAALGVITAATNKSLEADLRVCVPEMLEVNGMIQINMNKKSNRRLVSRSGDQFHDLRPASFVDRQNWSSRGGGFYAKW